jgi:glycosyltransferase involved in cell wall biosynthesis
VTPLAADRSVFYRVADPDIRRAARLRYGIGDHPYLLTLSTIEPRKNLAHLIRCFAQLAAGPDGDDRLRLVIVGASGWKTEAIFEEVERVGAVRERIIFTGYVPDSDLAALYSGADAFAYCSHYEGFGLPVLEAMCCGAPVVTTTGGAIPEVAGDAALMVDATDGVGLVTALRAARGNARLREAGLARAAEFTWSRTVGLTVDVYRFILSQIPGGSG